MTRLIAHAAYRMVNGNILTQSPFPVMTIGANPPPASPTSRRRGTGISYTEDRRRIAVHPLDAAKQRHPIFLRADQNGAGAAVTAVSANPAPYTDPKDSAAISPMSTDAYGAGVPEITP
jgi:hypothetical protein